jgi:hypothetical protein
MSCGKLFSPKSQEIQTYTTSENYMWLTDYVLAPGTSHVDFLVLLREVTGNFQAKPCFQSADVQPENPNSPNLITTGSYTNSNGYIGYHETASFTSALLVRHGLAYKNSTGTALGSAIAQLTVASRQCGEVIGTDSTMIQPGMTTTTDINYVPIGKFKPIVGLDQLMGAFVIIDNESTYLEYQLAIRTAKDPRAPHSWQTMEAAWANPEEGNSERNSTLLSIPAGANLTANMYFQAGIAFRKKSGAAGNPRAQIQAIVAATYA